MAAKTSLLAGRLWLVGSSLPSAQSFILPICGRIGKLATSASLESLLGFPAKLFLLYKNITRLAERYQNYFEQKTFHSVSRKVIKGSSFAVSLRTSTAPARGGIFSLSK